MTRNILNFFCKDTEEKRRVIHKNPIKSAMKWDFCEKGNAKQL